MPLTPGTRIGAYEILSPIGAGGMGDVYRARDPRLGREVAVKVLPPGLASRPDRLARFEREARSVAALNHPNIVTLHSIEEADGIHFLTMELVEGESLDRLVAPGGLPVARVLDIAIPLADALAAAHDRGVVHRDLKPANVMVTREGRVKVLNFGLAKLEAASPAYEGETAAADPHLTMEGHVLGTAAYMSPEQAEGKPTDARCDVFSFGVILYELATGQAPFRGASAMATIASVLTHRPRPLTEIRPDLPPAVAGIVGKCLEKDPRDRYRTALELRQDLERLKAGLAAASAAPAAPSIAVLPFANMSPDPADEFFSDGITEEIINALTQLPGLKVAARTSCFAFKGRHEDLRVVGEKLGAAMVLEGSVRKAGSRLRIMAQLINATDGYHLWSERYDREFADVFAIQDEIAGAIAEKLRIALGGSGGGAGGSGAGGSGSGGSGAGGGVGGGGAWLTAPRREPRNLEAYELFLKGRVLQTRRGSALIESVGCFQRAVELDPELTEAHAWLADSYRLLSIYGIQPAMEAVPRARAAAERALALDPNQVEGIATLAGIVALFDWDIGAAAELWDRALALDPSHVRALCERSLNLCLYGGGGAPAVDRALRDAQRAVELDSLSAWAGGMRAMVLGIVGKQDEAVSQARRAVELDAGNFLARWALVECLMMAGRYEEALTASEPALTMSGRHPYILTAVAAAYASLGRVDAANAVFQELEGRSRTGYMAWTFLAATAASAGRLEEARRLAVRAIEEREGILYFGTALPGWAAFRADAECAAVLRRAGS